MREELKKPFPNYHSDVWHSLCWQPTE